MEDFRARPLSEFSMPQFDFAALERLKEKLAVLRRNHVPTLNHYTSEPRTGFWHQPQKRNKSALSSTATCVSSLVSANLWRDEKFLLRDRAADVAAELIKKHTSAGLKEDNPFSLSFVAEGILDLLKSTPDYRIQISTNKLLIRRLYQSSSRTCGKASTMS